MLKIDQLQFAYGQKSILDGMNLQLEKGKVHGILGLNGSGKTTLFNLIYGTLVADGGSISWQNEVLQNGSIGFLETAPYFYPRITGREYLELFRLKNPDFVLESWNAHFGLPLNTLIETYSTGMRKKLSLLGIICLNRSIWLLDEPFNGLDLDASQTLKFVIKEAVNMGTTVLITSHVLESLLTLCDSAHHLEKGQIIRSFERENFKDLELYLEEKQVETATGIHQLFQVS